VRVAIQSKVKRRGVSKARLARVARAVMGAEGCPAGSELSVVIGDDRWITGLNRRYKGRGAATDVLAFPQDARPWAGSPVLGDVAISAETAARQADEFGHGLAEEMAVLLTHGILHLTGWRDDTSARRRRMMQRAEELLTEMGE
jgi:probable rRNA maturation factor